VAEVILPVVWVYGGQWYVCGCDGRSKVMCGGYDGKWNVVCGSR
jgi:hypothetical protein